MTRSLVVFSIADAPPPRLDKALARDVPEGAALSRSRIAKLIASGAVRINGQILRDTKHTLAPGDEVEITVEVASQDRLLPEDIALDILFEDEHLIVVNKPAGMVVHPAPGSPSGTLVNALMAHCGDTLSGIGGEKRPGIVHRIDKDTSGVLVVAKSDLAHHGLARQFADHTAQRAYLAICYGAPDASDPRIAGLRGVSFESAQVRIHTNLARHKTDRQRQAVTFEGGRHAVTRIRSVQTFGRGDAALIECRLETGRTHQIRVHMGYIGHGLIGDPVYGGSRRLSLRGVGEAGVSAARNFARQALHAQSLGFTHPVTDEEMIFTADIPQDMQELITKLSPL